MLSVVADDGSVEVTWDSPPGGETYSNEWVDFDDGTFENAIVLDRRPGVSGDLFWNAVWC